MEQFRALFIAPWVHWLALLFLCAAYLQGAFDKARNFSGAIDEMRHFGLSPAAPMAALLIVFEFLACSLILSGYYRWLGALALAGFTVLANFLADKFWEAPTSQRVMVANSFFEHWGLAGGFLLVAWYDLGGQHVR